MAEFTPITTQEQFEAIMKDRLERERTSVAKKYEGYTSPTDLEQIRKDYDTQISTLSKDAETKAKKYADYDKQIAERDTRLKHYETASVKTRIAYETGLPYEMASRLSGDAEEEIRKDAEALVALIGQNKPVAPLADQESKPSGKNGAISALAKSLRGE